MFDSTKNNKVRMITLIGMAVMIVAVAAKAATSSVLAAAAIHIAGLACFFVIEGVEKTPDSESGLSFKRFFSDLKKPGVIPLILLMLVLSPAEMLLSKAVFGRAYIDHVLGRISVPSLEQLPLLLFSQIVSVLGEEIEFRAFFVGKGMKRFPFWPVAVAGAVLFAAAHYAAGPAGGRHLHRCDPFCDPVPQDRKLPDQLHPAFSQQYDRVLPCAGHVRIKSSFRDNRQRRENRARAI